MKKLLFLLLGLTLSAGVMVACRDKGTDEESSSLAPTVSSESVLESSSESSSSEEKEIWYNVTFLQEGETIIVKQVMKGETLTQVPATKEKVGYTVQWDRTDFTNITADITVKAVATANTYKITYNAGEGATVTPAEQTVTYDAVPGTFATPTKEGYTFSGWQYDGKNVLASEAWKIASDVTFTATWAEIKADVCTVTFAQAGCNAVVKEVVKGTALTDIPAIAVLPEDEGYTVTWDIAEGQLTNITENITISSKRTGKEYTLTFDQAGCEEMKVVFGSKIGSGEKKLPTPTKEGYSFLGWAYEGTTTYVSDGTVWSVASNKKLEAKWEAKLCTIALNANGGTVKESTKSVRYGDKLGELPTPTKEGYTFGGWKYNGEFVNENTVWKTVEGGELIAQWVEESTDSSATEIWTPNY